MYEFAAEDDSSSDELGCVARSAHYISAIADADLLGGDKEGKIYYGEVRKSAGRRRELWGEYHTTSEEVRAAKSITASIRKDGCQLIVENRTTFMIGQGDDRVERTAEASGS
ncbi:hypothetical protein DFH09DRAFT_1082877 [Mycena vulgaris]|nr:hypothetical protein DFH09DRAFT_1082877 [Mycena vulgaris]